MNECVKTGFCFRLPNGDIGTGDLFYTFDELFRIRGVPKGRWQDGYVDAEISITKFTQRPTSDYSDSEPDMKLLKISNEFRKHIEEWYPELVSEMPKENIS